MNAVELGPVPPERRTQSPLDLLFIFAGANIVATTLVTGASLFPAFAPRQALTLMAAGSLLGAALVAALAPVGPRLGVPSVIAARAALGTRGAGLLALLLFTTNFAWIALNNVIAASACARVAGGPASERAWAFGLGVAATAVVALGPRAVGVADRLAVPLMLVVGVIMTAACLRLPAQPIDGAGGGGVTWLRGLDLVIGYQVSWLLMFADYPRYTRSGGRAVLAVFAGLALTALWFMPLGYLGARGASSTEPGAINDALGLGPWGALLLALGTLTTNFVNLYMSALALKSLCPGWGEQPTLWAIGLIGAALSLLSRAWIERYADFMLLLGATLVPVGGILLARFFLARTPVDAAALYDPAGAYAGFPPAALCAWVTGAAVYYAAGGIGATLPSLAVAVAVYLALTGRGHG